MKNLNTFKKLLETEKNKLITELKTVAKENPSVAHGWEAIATDLDSDSADANETADEIEEFDENIGIVEKLAAQLELVNQALEKVQAGTYGQCEVCGESIDEGRLKANPSATTCLKDSK